MSQTPGTIFDIQRFSIHDGPGIRTTVFLLGCPLRCLWCHNPEGMGRRPVLSFVAARCIGCGYCVRVCPHSAHKLDDSLGHVLDRELCEACGKCTLECFSGALEISGRQATAGEVIGIVLRDAPFYETSGGGMTLSGGEPAAQPDFSEALLRGAKGYGIHCAVETCGSVPYANLARLAAHTDLFLYDVKETDPRRHREFTGVDNRRILANLRGLHDAGAAVLLRLPIVPGYNDRRDHFEAVAKLADSMPRLMGVEVMPYHRLGLIKLERFGLGTPPIDVEQPSPATVEQWNRTLRELGVRLVGAEAR